MEINDKNVCEVNQINCVSEDKTLATKQQTQQADTCQKHVGYKQRIKIIFLSLLAFFSYFLIGGGIAFWLNISFGISQIKTTVFLNIWFGVVFGFLCSYFTNIGCFDDVFGRDKFKFTIKETIGYFIEFLVMVFICQLSAVCINDLVVDSGYQLYASEMGSASAGWTLVLTLFAAPVLEELLFRGLLFRWFSCAMPLWLSVTLTSLLFGISHGTILHIVSATLMGIFCCLVYYKTNRLTIPILVHIGYNFAAVLIAGVSVPDFMVLPLFVVPILCLFLIFIYTQIWQAKEKRFNDDLSIHYL